MGPGKPRILVTGAAGHVGQIVASRLADRYDLVLTDIRPLPQSCGLPFLQADIADPEAMRAACRGRDTLLHLACAPQLDATWEELLPANILGIYPLFRTAQECGIKRIIFTSSIQVLAGHPQRFSAPAAPALPSNLYGASKLWGEALGSVFAQNHGLSVLCLRLGWVLPGDEPRLVSGQLDPSLVLTHDDLVALITAAVEAPASMSYAIVNGLSNNRWPRLRPEGADRLPGYTPQDDAYSFVMGVKPRLRVRMGRAWRQLGAILHGDA